jgi:two-component system, OmpR family, sensor histidine kinase VicK
MVSPDAIKALHNPEVIIKIYSTILNNAKTRWDYYADTRSLPIPFRLELVNAALSDAKNRGVKLRFITEISKENIHFCKEIMSGKKIGELRHLDGVKGNFGLTDTEYISTSKINNESEKKSTTTTRMPFKHGIYSNVTEDIQQQQYIFETLWGKAIPAEQKIGEIEQGLTPFSTKILNKADEIVKQTKYVTDTSNWMTVCSSFDALKVCYNIIFDSLKNVLNKTKARQHKGIKWIGKIDNDDIEIIKLFLDLGMEIRHSRSVIPLNFSVTDKEVLTSVDKNEEDEIIQGLVVSNEPAYIQHFGSLFEEIWKDGIDAIDRIKEIEEGIEPSNIDLVNNTKEAVNRSVNMLKSARKEILILFATSNAFHRYLQNSKLQLLKQLAEQYGIRIRILVPSHEVLERLSNLMIILRQAEIRSIDNILQSRISIFVVDRKECMIAELKDDSKDSSEDALGLATFSQSKSIVLSYASIFESLWKQTEMYEGLKSHDKIQGEFINIAAHELRTPIMPILGVLELMKDERNMNNKMTKDIIEVKEEYINIMNRNARRLDKLASDILDITKIESNAFKMNKEPFDLADSISNIVDDFKKDHISSSSWNDKKTRLLLYEQNQNAPSVNVLADKNRLIQVIYNLLINAFKFTKEGDTILVNLEKEEGKQIVVKVKDTGTGIDPDISSKLFTKFATKSFQGIGLGLYISRSIVEAHNGKIWAENNSDGKGATFTFSLPMIKHNPSSKRMEQKFYYEPCEFTC